MRSLRSNGTDDRDCRSSLSRSSRRYNIRDPYHPNYNTPNRSQTDSGNRIPSYVVINRTNPTPSLDSPTSTTPYPSSRSSSNGTGKNLERPLTHEPVPKRTSEQRDRSHSVGKPREEYSNGRKTGSSSCPDCLHERPPGWQSSLPASTSQLDGTWECDACGSSSLGTSMIPIPGSWNNSWMSGYIPADPHPLRESPWETTTNPRRVIGRREARQRGIDISSSTKSSSTSSVTIPMRGNSSRSFRSVSIRSVPIHSDEFGSDPEVLIDCACSNCDQHNSSATIYSSLYSATVHSAPAALGSAQDCLEESFCFSDCSIQRPFSRSNCFPNPVNYYGGIDEANFKAHHPDHPFCEIMNQSTEDKRPPSLIKYPYFCYDNHVWVMVRDRNHGSPKVVPVSWMPNLQQHELQLQQLKELQHYMQQQQQFPLLKQLHQIHHHRQLQQQQNINDDYNWV